MKQVEPISQATGRRSEITCAAAGPAQRAPARARRLENRRRMTAPARGDGIVRMADRGLPVMGKIGPVAWRPPHEPIWRDRGGNEKIGLRVSLEAENLSPL